MAPTPRAYQFRETFCKPAKHTIIIWTVSFGITSTARMRSNEAYILIAASPTLVTTCACFDGEGANIQQRRRLLPPPEPRQEVAPPYPGGTGGTGGRYGGGGTGGVVRGGVVRGAGTGGRYGEEGVRAGGTGGRLVADYRTPAPVCAGWNKGAPRRSTYKSVVLKAGPGWKTRCKTVPRKVFE